MTWTVRITSVSINGRLSLNDVMLIETKWNVGSFGFAEIMAAVVAAVAAPMMAEVQLHVTILGCFLRRFWVIY